MLEKYIYLWTSFSMVKKISQYKSYSSCKSYKCLWRRLISFLTITAESDVTSQVCFSLTKHNLKSTKYHINITWAQSKDAWSCISYTKLNSRTHLTHKQDIALVFDTKSKILWIHFYQSTPSIKSSVWIHWELSPPCGGLQSQLGGLHVSCMWLFFFLVPRILPALSVS